MATAAVGDELPSAQPAPPARDAVPNDAPPPAPPSLDAANAVAGARPPPKRPVVAAALVDAPPSPPRPALQTPVASGRRSALPAAEAGNGARCREILVRATIGGALSDEDRSVLRRGCQPRG